MTAECEQVGDGVYLVRTPLVNWAILVDGSDVVLVDTGYPGQLPLVLDSIRALGKNPRNLAAVLITHAHIDHLGNAQHLADTYGTPILMATAELAHARRESHHALTPAGLAMNLWRPRVARWTAAALRVGVHHTHGVDQPQPFPTPGALDLPGHPVPVLTPGHTPGHCVYHLPQCGAVISGDALVTGHMATRHCGPQLLPAMFDDNRDTTVAALTQIGELPGELLLPGHGPLHRGPLAEAAERARTLARPHSHCGAHR
ncbi:MBL fold metallo-hydrolase [Nocardia abscessus]|uniref:MBL fold metallo-hydrolase n=1 Tax=Nocardia TaxID=1817 RepID=UPI00189587A7|nr:MULTISPECIES: MBL fold metallo-hydrolase [Nocardia]MBF6222615.1 MBL fold metallo-hydrolase [Nocardia abscessus]